MTKEVAADFGELCVVVLAFSISDAAWPWSCARVRVCVKERDMVCIA